MKLYLRSAAWAAVGLATLGLGGCLATGGGQLAALAGNGGKINTGFQLRCDDTAGVGRMTGQFQYNDRGAHVAVHVKVNQALSDITQSSLTCTQLGLASQVGGLTVFAAVGGYTPQPANRGAGGQALVFLADRQLAANAGCPAGVDLVVVQLSGGVHDGYAQSACLDKGNITMAVD